MSDPSTTDDAVPGDVPFPSAEEATPALLPLRLLGMGLWIVWLWCMHTTVTQSLDGAFWADQAWTDVDLSMRVEDVGTLLLFALLHRKIGALSSRTPCVAAGILGIALGTTGLLLSLNNLLPNLAALRWACGIVAGFGGAVLFLLWAEVYSRLPSGRVFLFGALSLVLAGVTSFLAHELAAPLPVLCTLAAPIASYLLWWASERYTRQYGTSCAPGSRREPERHDMRYSFPWKPMLIMAFAGFAAGFCNFALFGQNADIRMGATFIVGTAISLCLVVPQSRVSPASLAKVALAIVTVGLVLVAFLDTRFIFIACLLIMLAYIGICVFTLSLLANLAHRYAIPSLWLFGMARASSELMMGVGSYTGHIPFVATIPSSRFMLAALCIVGLVALGVLAALWMSERTFSGTWAIQAIDIHDGSQIQDQQTLLALRCEQAARRFALTAREAEVLEMLLQNKSYQEICHEMMLSMSTIKTHVRHVYGKLGVHTRAEAMARVSE